MITIMGGGLAGLSLGVFLRKLGVEAKLYEAGKYPTHKVCGEFISGVAAETVEKMGLGCIISDSVHHQRMDWWVEEKKVMERALPSVAWGISRYDLDQKLAKEFKKLGGKLFQGKRVKVEDFDSEGLVVSSGKSKASGGSQWIGLKLHLKDVSDDWISGLEMHVGDSGYVGLCEVESKRVNCCGLFKVDRNIKEKGSSLLLEYLRANQLTELSERLEGATVDESSVSAIAGFNFGHQPVEFDFLLGDSDRVCLSSGDLTKRVCRR